jgi:ubiquinone/menaquinone biosynthesis C-methylase UbiE
MTDLGGVTTRALVRELAARMPALVQRRVLGGRLLRQRPHSAVDTTPFAELELLGAPSIPLWRGYRDAVKAGWRMYFWPTRALLEVAARTDLPREAAGLVGEIRAARTLPVPLGEAAAVLESLARTHADLVRPSGVFDDTLGRETLVVVPDDALLAKRRDYYRRSARSLLRRLRAHGLAPEATRLLEIGCGTGYMTFAAAAEGVAEAVGLDRELTGYDAAAERPRMVQAFFGGSELPVSARLETGDIHALPFGDGDFDAVVSFSTVEHLGDLPAALREVARVLRPGGLSYHVVDPWFGPGGGHSLCILDFPWGHCRLDEHAFERYVRAHRPHEADEAMSFYRHGFQSPRLTLAETEVALVEAGFELLDWTETRSAHPLHRSSLDGRALADVVRLAPWAAVCDLLTDSLALLVRRR